MKLPGGFAAMRQTFALRDYRLYVLGNWSSTLGLWVQRIAIGWMTWDMTHSTTWLGAIAFAEAAPTILFALIAGTVLDRVNYWKMLRFTQACSMLYSVTLAVVTFSGLMNIWLMLTLTIIRGTIVAFNRPSRMTVVYNLVGRDLLPSALGMNSLIFNSSRFIGPAIGGVILAAFGSSWTFAFAAVMFFVFTVCLRLIDFVPPPKEPRAAPCGSMLTETWDGILYIVRHNGISQQLMLLVVTSIFAKPLTDLLPGFAAEVFDKGPHGLAMLLTFHGIGAMIGSLWLASRGGLRGLTSITIGNILLMSLALLAFSASNIFWLGCMLTGVCGFAFIVQSVSNQTLIQSAVDPLMRGRVISVYGMVAQGVPSIGSFMMGAAAESLGLRIPVAVGAAICLGLWAWAWHLRHPLAAALEADEAMRGVGKSERVS
ncbi:MAG TPA: MFS transporter [Alphaproteobacteria bacterium]|jgi:predicted MFS family arabinose efflux permease